MATPTQSGRRDVPVAVPRSPGRVAGDDFWTTSPFDRNQDWRHIVEASRQGFTVALVDAVVESGRLTAAEIDTVVLTRRDLASRRKVGTLTPEQSDRLARVMHVLLAAEETFGSRELAARWLRRPSTTLDGDAPIDHLDTTSGTREVERILGRIDHGIAA